jgi:nicotinate-nucleotide adenylyltransferase
MQIALFGTSADPPTRAHQQIISWLSQRFPLVAVWAADNPDKVHGAMLAQRARMLELLVADLQCPQVQVHQELSHRYTIHTLKLAQQQWPTAHFSLVIGADLVPQIERWQGGAELIRQVELLVVPRPGWSIQPEMLEHLSNLGGRVQMVTDLDTLAVSSTAIRQESDLWGLTESVAAYIDRLDLYRLKTKNFS